MDAPCRRKLRPADAIRPAQGREIPQDPHRVRYASDIFFSPCFSSFLLGNVDDEGTVFSLAQSNLTYVLISTSIILKSNVNLTLMRPAPMLTSLASSQLNLHLWLPTPSSQRSPRITPRTPQLDRPLIPAPLTSHIPCTSAWLRSRATSCSKAHGETLSRPYQGHRRCTPTVRAPSCTQLQY